ncbi:MAG TPA: hypothetical protein VG273_05320 [Bryobacteraceae bacterium]|jgi:hypothetical protein|nr:hypothetical protein [Bryobacteraceae bacterium]
MLVDVKNTVLAQTFSAGPYIGKSIRFSAYLRLQRGDTGGNIHIRMRINYADGHADLRDSLMPPVTGDRWERREVFGDVKPGAVSIGIFSRYFPPGVGWVRAPAFEVVDSAKVQTPPEFGVSTGSFPVKDAAGKTIKFGAWIKTENVTRGYAGLWWRADGPKAGQTLAFDNSAYRSIGGKTDALVGENRGSTGTSNWTWREIELPVPVETRNINFGFLLPGNGTAWFDGARVELDGQPYFSPEFDFDFESAALRGFRVFPGVNSASRNYKVGLDNTTAYTGSQSLKMQFVGYEDSRPSAVGSVKKLDPVTVDVASRSTDYSTPVPISFINHSRGPVDIYWIDYQGRRMLYREQLPVGSTWQTGTFLTHLWLVVASGTGGTKERGTGRRVAAFEASSPAGGDAMITDSQ